MDSIVQLIANESYRSEILTSPGLYNEGAVSIVGKHYNGCILEGPSIVFNKSVILPHKVRFGTCPIGPDCLIREEIKGVNACANEPCMRKGTCQSVNGTYTCTCFARFTGRNCQIDMGSPCNQNPPPCKNSGECSEDTLGNYYCRCTPRYTGMHKAITSIENIQHVN